jgi:CHAD domain-containing protein
VDAETSLEVLRRASLRAARWRLVGKEWKRLLEGLEATYRRARREMARARAAPTNEHLHDWRKQVKYLWHQYQLITPIAPGAFGHRADQLQLLAGYLGDEHDLAVLEETLLKRRDCVDARDAAALERNIGSRRSALTDKAFVLGAQLFARRPRVLSAAIDRRWAGWRRREVHKRQQTRSRGEAASVRR